MEKETLKEKTAKGLFWGALNNGTMQLLNIVIGIFLARLLTPTDYGLVGMLAVFYSDCRSIAGKWIYYCTCQYGASNG